MRSHPDTESASTAALDADVLATRALTRLADRLPAPEESPLVTDAGFPCCPWCRAPLAVRKATLGWVWAEPSGARDHDGERVGEAARKAHIHGLSLKCATGCCFRPDFDVPLTRAEYDAERAAYGGRTSFDFGIDAVASAAAHADRYDQRFDADARDRIADHLEALGYIVS